MGPFELGLNNAMPHSTTEPAIRLAPDDGTLPGMILNPAHFAAMPNESNPPPRPVVVDVHCKILDFEPSVDGPNPRWQIHVADGEGQRKRLTLWGEHARLPLQKGMTILARCAEARYKPNPNSNDNRVWLNLNAWGNTAMVIPAVGQYEHLKLP